MDPMLLKLADSVPAARTLEELTRPLLELLQSVTGLESTYLTHVDLEQGVQHVLFANNSSRMQIPEGMTVPWGDTLCKRALDEGRSYTDNVGDCWGDSDVARELGITTYVSTAVRSESGGLYGTLCGVSSASVQMNGEVERMLGMFSHLIGQHVEREHLLERLRHANHELSNFALTDTLTGLPNRRALILELNRMLAWARREGKALFVAFIDLDGFKGINDRHGHETGDRFLAAMATRLREGLRASDLVARLGGDEFVVVAPASAAGETAEMFRQRLSQWTVAHFQLGSVAIDYAGASVGIVTTGPTHAKAEDVLVEADAAMYEVKRSRK